MRRTLLLLVSLLAFSGCAVEDVTFIDSNCGPAPRNPGVVAWPLEVNGVLREVMTREDYIALVAYVADLEAFIDCRGTGSN